MILLGRLLCLSFVASMAGAEETHSQAASPRPTTDFHAFVNWDFHHRKKLKGWQATALAIQRSLAQWSPGRSTHRLVENGDPAALRGFLHALPARAGCELSIVYLASHQSPAGEWDFVQGKLESLNAILTAAAVPRHPARIVILDACFAEAVRRDVKWEREWGSPGLFAAGESEETQELDFRSPQPVDLRRRYPAASAWLRENLGPAWDGRLSFLGFVWVQTFVTTRIPPADMKAWSEFLRRCEQTAGEFRKNAGKRLASQVTMAPAAPPLR